MSRITTIMQPLPVGPRPIMRPQPVEPRESRPMLPTFPPRETGLPLPTGVMQAAGGARLHATHAA